MPYVAAMHGDIFYPTFLLRMMLPTDVAMTWALHDSHLPRRLLHVSVPSCVGTRLCRRASSAVSSYLMCGPIAAYVSPGHDGKLFVSALLPLALFFLIRGIRDGRNWAWGGLALIIGGAVLSPHPQLLQYMLLACGAFALYLAFAELELPDGTRVRLDRRVAVRRLALRARRRRHSVRSSVRFSSFPYASTCHSRLAPAVATTTTPRRSRCQSRR